MLQPNSVDDGGGRVRCVLMEQLEFGQRVIDGGVGEVTDFADWRSVRSTCCFLLHGHAPACPFQ